MSNYRNDLLEAKRQYKAKNYAKSCKIYTRLYNEIPFDNSAKYSYAWAVYQAKVRNYASESQLFEDVDLITNLTKQNDLNRTKLCVYTMSVFKVFKLLYHNNEYESLPYWLDKINPDFLDEVRFTRDGEIYPSNRESYYIYSSVTYFKLMEYEKCIAISAKALNSLTKFTADNGIWFEWRTPNH